jgi:SAM-dependent methyltransferase
MTWEGLADWWIEELAADPVYSEEIGPLLLELLDPQPGARYLDVGCGNGRLMAIVGRTSLVVGCDLSRELLRRAIGFGPCLRTRLPELGCLRPGVFEGAYVSLVLEHLSDDRLFDQIGSAVGPTGVLAMVINHPIWTAPESSPIEESDGEILWRPGRYFGRGHSEEPAGAGTVRFYHRTLAAVLNAASNAGWDLDRVEERGVSPARVARYPEYAGQEQIPRLLGVRWRRRP